MRPQERFGRQRRPEGVRVREASALETIRLVLPKLKRHQLDHQMRETPLNNSYYGVDDSTACTSLR